MVVASPTGKKYSPKYHVSGPSQAHYNALILLIKLSNVVHKIY
jgi:hypothetical protein